MKSHLLENISLFLQEKKGYKKSWFRSFFGIFLVIIISVIVIVISNVFNSSMEGSSVFAKNLTENSELLIAANIMNYIALGFICFPFIILFTFWIIGINQTSKSKFFHLFMWIFVFLAILLSVISLIIFIRCGITNYNIYA